MTVRRALLLLVFVIVACGCGTSTVLPTVPSPMQPNAPGQPPIDTSVSAGTVFDTAFRRLSGATVEVVSGAHAGVSAMTGSGGEFHLTVSVATGTQIRLTHQGYVTAILSLTPYGYYYLSADAPSTDISGAYTMTFTAAPACEFPSELQRFRYNADISPGQKDGVPSRTTFDLALSGAEVFENPSIGVAGAAIGFRLFNDGYPYIVEQLNANLFVTITGFAEIAAWPTGAFEISVPFDGWIAYQTQHPRVSLTPVINCRSRQHLLTITRR